MRSGLMLPHERNLSLVDRIVNLVRSVDPFADLDGEERRMHEARNDFHAFMRMMYPNYTEGWHLEVLREALLRVERGECKRLIITMPPRHSKSMHVSEGYPAWYLGRHPHHRVIAASHSQSLADTFSRRVRQKFTDPYWPFRTVRIADDKGKVQAWDIEGSQTGGYVAVGVGGSPTGLGADLIIIDDPVRNQADADSALIRERTWEWFEGTMYTRRQPGAAIIVTATRWHEDDLTGRLLQRAAEGGEQWDQVHLPALDEDTGEYLWPEFWSEADYAKARLSSDRVWNAQYQGRPSNREGNLLKQEWFPDAPMGEPYIRVLQSWDCAEKPGVTNDWSVCVTIGVTEHSYDIINVWRARVEFPDLVQAARDQATWAKSLYPDIPYSVVVEDKSAGTQLIQVLNATTRLPVYPAAGANTANAKVDRVIRVTPLAKSRRIRILQGAPWRADLFREFRGFPNEAHDDIVDSSMIGVIEASGGARLVAQSRDYLQRRDEESQVRSRRPRPPSPRP